MVGSSARGVPGVQEEKYLGFRSPQQPFIHSFSSHIFRPVLGPEWGRGGGRLGFQPSPDPALRSRRPGYQLTQTCRSRPKLSVLQRPHPKDRLQPLRLKKALCSLGSWDPGRWSSRFPEPTPTPLLGLETPLLLTPSPSTPAPSPTMTSSLRGGLPEVTALNHFDFGHCTCPRPHL